MAVMWQQKNNSRFFLASALVFAISIVIAYWQIQVLLQLNSQVITHYQIVRAANQALISIDEAALEVSTFLMSNDSESLDKLPEIIISAQVNFETLKQLKSIHPYPEKSFVLLESLFNEKLNFLRLVVAEYTKGDKNNAIKVASDKNRLRKTEQINLLLLDIRENEDITLEKYRGLLDANRTNSNLILIVMGLVGALLLLICSMIANKSLKK